MVAKCDSCGRDRFTWDEWRNAIFDKLGDYIQFMETQRVEAAASGNKELVAESVKYFGPDDPSHAHQWFTEFIRYLILNEQMDLQGVMSVLDQFGLRINIIQMSDPLSRLLHDDEETKH